ncbi:hypothetical protein N7533_002703 [Penicillium manginii]|jgi:NAD(P)H-dependent FMN reductase|uniref:uncharacterized protein n=1 Tax=Penicillium manginii TaxID=203109 RepID=UPI002549665A|nr:uncharacterized protein N7533_002703 [Penicillium manginii]KAJ5764022.1 hypothetical protein N7533_002703 [Penicillium manginii]
MSSKKIAVVVCSIREPRLNPFIARYVLNLAAPYIETEAIEILDIGDQGLSLYSEPAVPSHLPETDPTPHYAHNPTRAWSATVQQYSAFIFVTPQYNWSIPAALKNALDLLFHEWRGKPAAIVTYGGRGGGKAEGHLRQILQGLRMNIMPTTPALTVKSTTLDDCLRTQQISVADLDRWREAGVEEQMPSMFVELLKKVRGD